MYITYSSNYMHREKLSASADLRKSNYSHSIYFWIFFCILLQLYHLFYTHSLISRLDASFRYSLKVICLLEFEFLSDTLCF